MAEVSVLGLGNMGAALAKALLAAGHDVHVWNRTTSKADELRAVGASVHDAAAQALRGSGLTVMCLLDYEAIDAAIGDVIDDIDLDGWSLVQLTLGRPDESARLAARINRRGGRYLGGFIKAYPREIGTDDAELHYSGSAEVFSQYRDVLSALGTPVFVSDDVAAGNYVNNAGVLFFEAVVGSYFESAAAAVASGVPVEKIERTLEASLRLTRATIGHSWSEISSGVSSGASEATISVHANALGSAVSSMADLGLPSRFGSLALDVLDEAIATGRGGEEISTLYAHHRVRFQDSTKLTN